MRNKLLFVYNYVSKENMTDELKECASEQTVLALENALKSLAFEIINVNLYNENQLNEIILANQPISGAFVIAEGFLDSPHTLYDGSGALSVRKVLEAHNIPYTHSTPKTMEACRNKDLTYEVLQMAGVTIPKYFSLPTPAYKERQLDEAEATIGYPMFVKPAGGGNSLGIDEMSICHNREELIRKFNQLGELIGDQPVLIETFLSGREFTVAVLGNADPQVLPIIEFPNDVQVRSHAVKAMEHEKRASFSLISRYEETGLQIANIALQVYEGLQGKDMIRLDMKTDDFGNIYVIDVNGTPSLSLKGSVSFMISSLGITMDELIGFMVKEIIDEQASNENVQAAWESVRKKIMDPSHLVVA
ncbi:D-alanine--D-alanine ligase [Evansella vedderi]|uniref:D-alanine--D-alanine ligase n=1 Tax=Evansella vedderi TaxID=38282 RepID=A0ABT9ZW46_9BACI|nr:ATP-grasp domain-containing protein [Evansella vedderi]MDQ0254966.1 D-alanine--D-alanine ligase [Evansella vedderi]